MNILVINGNPKSGGFIAGALDIVQEHLRTRGAEVSYLRLADARIQDCRGCFTCLKTGSCVLDDDVHQIIQNMLEADGFVVGSPVRNGLTTACYKRFYERISYPLGFPLRLEDKHTLALSSVGMMGGKSVNKKLLGLQDIFHTRLSGYLFFKVGMPSTLKPADVKAELERAADKLMDDIEAGAKKRLFDRIAAAVDRIMVRNCVLMKSPEPFEFVIKCWKDKGYIR